MEQYPDIRFYSDNDILFEIFSITYGVRFGFLPYDLKITESLTPEWGQESVIGRMDSIATFKRMTRTMTATFKVRAMYGQNLSGLTSPYLPVDDVLHAVDHIKKTLYPRYNSKQILTSPPLFKIKYANLIAAGEETYDSGVLCYINSFSANPSMEVNKVSYKLKNSGKQREGQNPVGTGASEGGLSIAAYPNIFDFNIGFTVLNENIAIQQVDGILNKRYFYNYQTDVGPRGGHGLSSGHNEPEQEYPPLTPEQRAEMDEETKAREEALLKGAP